MLPVVARTSSSPLPQHIAIYAGSFDPVTRGHLDVAKRARPEFDRLIVAVGHNPSKNTELFTAAERVGMLRQALHDTDIEVASFDGLLATYAARRGANTIVRGMRGWGDCLVEWTMMGINFVLGRGLMTRFIAADPSLANVSSTRARQAAANGEPLEALVTPQVAQSLRQRLGNGATPIRAPRRPIHAEAVRRARRSGEALGGRCLSAALPLV